MDKYERRRLSLEFLIRSKYKTPAAFARAIGRSPSYVSRMLYPEGKKGKKRIADDMLEHMENECGLDRGWFDSDHDGQAPSNVIRIRPKSSEDIVIRQFETGGAMGVGLELRDQPGVIQSWSVNREWLQKNVRSFSAANNLCIVTGFGDSMRPMFNPGDPLIVDTGVNSVEFDAIYFFRVGNEGFIKRLQRIPTPEGTIIRAKSENKKYDAWDISTGMDLEVFGRVLKVWCSEDF